MKKYTFIVIVVLITNLASLEAQKTPYFLTTIYFEDAIGNIDSMEIGNDPSATGRFNTEWGEVLNTEPFDSVFDVRAFHFFEDIHKPAKSLIKKRIIESTEISHNGQCVIGYPFEFYIKVKYGPLSIWVKNPNEFEKVNCPNQNYNFFTPDSFIERLWPWEWLRGNPRYGCINRGPYIWHVYRSDPEPDSEDPYYILYPSLGNDKDTIFGLVLFTGYGSYWCDPDFVDTKEIPNDLQNEDGFNIYPNPAENYLVVESVENSMLKNIQIFTASGNMIQSQKISIFSKTYKLDLENYLPGLYIIRITCTDGSQSFRKFIKN